MTLRFTAWALFFALATLAKPALAHEGEAAKVAKQNSHAHHHHGHAHGHGHDAGKQLGQQLQQQGNYDLAQRLLINQTARKAMENSAKIDGMLKSQAINQEGWSKLKETMTQSMMTAIEDQTQEMEVLQPMDTRSVTLDGATPSTEVNINIAGPTVAPPPEPEMELESGEAPDTETLAGIAKDQPTAEGPKDVVDLRAAAPLVFALDTSRAVETYSAPASEIKAPRAAEAVIKNAGTAGDPFGDLALSQARAEANEKKNLLLAQQLMQGKPALKAKSDARPKKRKTVLGRTMNKVVKLLGLEDKHVPRAVSSTGFGKHSDLSEALALPMPEEELVEEEVVFEWDELFVLFFVALLAVGFAVSLYLLRRHTKPMQVLVPGAGEHFTIRQGDEAGVFVLDVKDVRGQLIRSAGMLRPESVARAAVLPPALAAQLGATNSFDRFEFTANRRFERTEKEEGYQVFPFLIENKRAS